MSASARPLPSPPGSRALPRLGSLASLAGRGALWLLFYFALVGFVSSGAAASLGHEQSEFPALFCGMAAIIALTFARRS